MAGLFLSQVLLFSALPFYFTFLERPVRQVSFFVCIALYLLIGGFFGNIYSLPLTDDITISGGNLCYGAFMMTSVLFVLVERDIFILRQLLRLVVIVDIFNVVFSSLVFKMLNTENVINPHQISPALFSVSLPFIILGGVLIFSELFMLFFAFEKLKRVRMSASIKAVLYIVLFVLTLCVDGILFPLIAFGVTPEVINIVIGGLAGKIIMACSFAVPLLVFITVRQSVFKEYLEADPFRWKLILMSSHDLMTDLLEKENQLNQAAAVFSHAHEGMALVNQHGVMIQANPALLDMLMLSPQAITQDLKIDHFFSVNGKPLECSLATAQPWRGEVDFITTTQDIHHGLLSVNPVDSASDGLRSYIYSLINIDAIKQAREQLRHLATHDQLTGLPNRRLLDARIKEMEGRAHTMIIIDVDHFKDVNDSYGHVAGDVVLKEVAQRILTISEQIVGGDCLLCRTGGDELALLIATDDSGQISSIVTNIQRALKQRIVIPPMSEISVSVSVGISVHAQPAPDSQSDADIDVVGDLLQEADTALYEAKRKQRGSCEFYHRSLTLHSQRNLELTNKLRQAIDTGSIHVFYQPQIDSRSNVMTGVEALVRWMDDAEGWISPMEFIPVAERSGLIEELGVYVLKQSCKQGRIWLDLGYEPIKISVNVSAIQLRFGQLPEIVALVLKETGYPASHLELEITESSLLEREKEVKPQLTQLRNMGVTLAIDDFGTGYSSLSYLYNFPFTTLKIDRSFVTGLPENQTLRQLSETIVALGKGMDFNLVVEGIETLEQQAFFTQLGCYCIQGFLYSPALSAEQLEKWMKRCG
jgi:diguanylate cyclase (GGDEF)-like protein